MKRKLALYAGIVLLFVFALAAISAIAAIREAGAALRESLPEIANQYLIVEGMPAEPSETVIQYYQALDETGNDSGRTAMVMFIIFAVVVTAGLVGFLVIGPEGMSGLLRQKRLLMLREGRGAGPSSSRPQQRRDDEWMETAWRQQAPAALPALTPPSTPWLLPAPAAREEEDDAR